MNDSNLKPWPRGVSGNPGGRPRKKPVTEELERLLCEEAPNGQGQPWATVIAQALLHEASKGNVQAIRELANRVEGKPVQAVAVNEASLEGLAERIEKARKRVEEHEKEKLDTKIAELADDLGLCETCRGRMTSAEKGTEK